MFKLKHFADERLSIMMGVKLHLECTCKLAVCKPIVCPTFNDLGGNTRKATEFWPKLGLKLRHSKYRAHVCYATTLPPERLR